MKAVFDTNIFISALVFPGGRADAALLKVVSGKVELFISKPIIHEVLDVLARKFAREPEQLARTAVFLSDIGRVVRPKRKLAVLHDEPDNRILECAAAAHVDVIVTGDRAMLALGEFNGIRIVPLGDFVAGR
jgi:putative PIN family toxin of toxin-antitoxin system